MKIRYCMYCGSDVEKLRKDKFYCSSCKREFSIEDFGKIAEEAVLINPMTRFEDLIKENVKKKLKV